jgi:large subunit ribosomal protein L6
MSRIGKKSILIPENVEIKIDNNIFSVKGPLGELSREFKDEIEIF